MRWFLIISLFLLCSCEADISGGDSTSSSVATSDSEGTGGTSDSEANSGSESDSGSDANAQTFVRIPYSGTNPEAVASENSMWLYVLTNFINTEHSMTLEVYNLYEDAVVALQNGDDPTTVETTFYNTANDFLTV